MEILDRENISDLFIKLAKHEKAQDNLISELKSVLLDAINNSDSWKENASKILNLKEKTVPVLTTEEGKEMSAEEIASIFGEDFKKAEGIDLNSEDPFKGMSLEEIENWEKDQYNKLDIYSLKGRVRNLATLACGDNINSQGEMLINSFVHVFMDLYKYAESLENKETKTQLNERIRKHESAPGLLISAFKLGIKND